MNPLCARCPDAINAINGRHCNKFNIYVTHAPAIRCPRVQFHPDTMSNPSENQQSATSQVAIIRQENISMIVRAAPDSFSRNSLSTHRCIDACEKLIEQINAGGMTDELDKIAATYIQRSRNTIKEMNERRSPVTKLFDQIRAEFTVLENAIDPSRPGTVPYRLQELRNQYAAEKRRQEEERRRQEEIARAIQQAKLNCRAECDEDFRLSFNRHLTAEINRLNDLYSSATLENYPQVLEAVSNTSVTLPPDWHPVSSVRKPYNLTQEEVNAIADDSFSALYPSFAEQYKFEIEDLRSDILQRLPSRKTELERLAQASAEEADRLQAELRQREAQEAERKESRRQAREKAEQEKAAVNKANAEIAGLFDSTAIDTAYTPKTKVSYRMSLASPQAYLAMLTAWWQREGCSLSVEELGKIFRKQVTFCEKLANKEKFFVEAPGIRYQEEVKAR